MNCLKIALAAAMLAAAPGITSPSFAQGVQCSCVAPLSDGIAGQIVTASGKILSSQPAGLADAGPGTPIGIGSQIVTGANSSAQIAIGSCSVPVGANTEVIISEIGGDICVQTTEVVTPPSPPPNTLPVVLGLGAAAGGIAAIATIGGGDEGASQ